MGVASLSSVLPFSGDPSSGNRHAAGLLGSWKEISTYLSRGVRTVQRWELDLGLPVHRTSAGKRAPVFAFEQEIDAWLQQRPGVCSKASTCSLRDRPTPLNSRQQRLIESVHELSQNALALERQVTAQVFGPNTTSRKITLEELTDAAIGVQSIMDAVVTVQKLLNTAVAQRQVARRSATRARTAASGGGELRLSI